MRQSFMQLAPRALALPLVLGLIIALPSTAPAQSTYEIGGGERGYLAGQIRRAHGRYGEGRMAVTDVVQHEGPASSRFELGVSVVAGSCYVAVAVGNPSVSGLSLQVVDGFGNVRAEGATAAHPHARFCPSLAGRWTVRVKTERGYGQVRAQVFGGPR